MKIDHLDVTFQNDGEVKLCCRHCADQTVVKLPCRLNTIVRFMESYIDLHEECHGPEWAS